MIPYYLKDRLTDIHENENETTAVLISTTANTDLEIFCYGEISCGGSKNPIIDEGDYPVLIVAKDPLSGEEFVMFDGGIHGYDAMFCNEQTRDCERKLVRLNEYPDKVQVMLGYSIDYDSEKTSMILTKTAM